MQSGKGNTYLRSAKEASEQLLNRKSNCVQCAMTLNEGKSANQYVAVMEAGKSLGAGYRWVIPVRHVKSPSDLQPVEWHFVTEALKGLSGNCAFILVWGEIAGPLWRVNTALLFRI